MLEDWNEELRTENRRLLALLTDVEEVKPVTDTKDLLPISGRITRRSMLRDMERKQFKIAADIKKSKTVDEAVS